MVSLVKEIESMYESEPLSEEFMGSHCRQMRKSLCHYMQPLDVDLPHAHCVSQILSFMKKSQEIHGFIDNYLIELFVHRAIKRSIEASKVELALDSHSRDGFELANGFELALYHIAVYMGLGEDEDSQGVYPRIDEFDEFIPVVVEAEDALAGAR